MIRMGELIGSRKGAAPWIPRIGNHLSPPSNTHGESSLGAVCHLLPTTPGDAKAKSRVGQACAENDEGFRGGTRRKHGEADDRPKGPTGAEVLARPSQSARRGSLGRAWLRAGG